MNSRNDQSLSTVVVGGGTAAGSGPIGLMSGLPARVRRWGLILYWLCMFLLTHWPGLDEVIPKPRWLFPRFDLVVHFCMYAGWAVAWSWVLAAGNRSRARVAGWLIAGAAAYAVFDELSQSIVGREPAISHFMADMAGVTVVLLLMRAWTRRRSRESAGLGRPGRG